MKILHVTEAMAGGVLSYLIDLNRLLAVDNDVYIAYGIRENTPDKLNELFSDGVSLIPLPILSKSLNPCNIVKEINALKKIIENIRPDILHLHSTIAGFVGRMIPVRGECRAFYTPHSYYFQNKELNFFTRKIFYIAEWLFAHTRCITIACGIGEWRWAKKLSSKALYVNNGIDTKYIDEVKIDVKNHKDIKVYASGRICHHKNPELFNSIAKMLSDIEFVWIGDGEEREKLTSSNITVTGNLSRDEAIRKAAGCDIFFMGSRYEGLSISLLEAMYMGKICVCSNIDGVCEVIKDKENGFICNNQDEYIDMISSIARNIPRIVGIQAMREVINKYTLESMSARYMEIYYKERAENG